MKITSIEAEFTGTSLLLRPITIRLRADLGDTTAGEAYEQLHGVAQFLLAQQTLRQLKQHIVSQWVEGQELPNEVARELAYWESAASLEGLDA